MSPTDSLADEGLAKMIGKLIKVFLKNGKALDGKLLKYDKKTLVLSPESYIKRKDISTFYPLDKSPINAAHRKT